MAQKILGPVKGQGNNIIPYNFTDPKIFNTNKNIIKKQKNIKKIKKKNKKKKIMIALYLQNWKKKTLKIGLKSSVIFKVDHQTSKN